MSDRPTKIGKAESGGTIARTGLGRLLPWIARSKTPSRAEFDGDGFDAVWTATPGSNPDRRHQGRQTGAGPGLVENKRGARFRAIGGVMAGPDCCPVLRR